MKADQEWQSLESKLQGTETGWEQTKVIPMLALAPSSGNDEVTPALLDQMMDLSAQVPSSDAGVHPMLPVGGLDLNVGVNLPAEELIGQMPKVCSPLYLQPCGGRMKGVCMSMCSVANRVAVPVTSNIAFNTLSGQHCTFSWTLYIKPYSTSDSNFNVRPDSSNI